MKIFKLLTLLILSTQLLDSCSQEPVGYIGLEDVDKPTVNIISPTNGTVLSDTLENIYFEVNAFDLFGLSRVTLHVNNHSLSIYEEGSNFIFDIPQEFFIDDSNLVYATAVDKSKNNASTATNVYSFDRSIIISNPIDNLVLLDITEEYTIDLNQVFIDTYGVQDELNFELISNSNSILINAEISNEVLSLYPKRYFKGNSTITVKAFSGKRHRLYQFDVQINLSKPLIKVQIPDSLFRLALIERNGFTDFADDSVALDDAQELLYLDLAGYNDISNLTGIFYFSSLEKLRLVDNNISYLDLSNNVNIKEFEISGTGLTSLNLNNLLSLELLFINAGIIGAEFDIDLSNNTNLKELSLGMLWYIKDIHLNLSQNNKLNKLRLYEVNISDINLSEKQELNHLFIQYSNLSILDLRYNSSLKYINLLNNDRLKTTFVWQLPLPSDVELYKDDHNELVVP